ncbi:MAG: ABC transporter ATP-binding protein [Pseudomonadota bacterium]
MHELNLELWQGQVTGFLGLNGAGKTTSMRLLCGTLAPDSGSVSIAGHDLRDHPIAARAQLGYLPDTPPLYGELTVKEYLNYCAKLRGVATRDVASAVQLSCQRTGLGDYSEQRCEGLSRGYRQRLGIAQAIVHSPRVVILDEPTPGLDPRQIEEIRELIRALRASATVLLSTHLLAEVHAVCDNVIVLHDGRVVHSGPVDASLETTFFSLTGGGDP